MKKSSIWFISVVMGISFIALFFLQTRYFQEVYEMRKNQFDESVRRSLYHASRKLELDETQARLERVILNEGDSLAATNSYEEFDQIRDLPMHRTALQLEDDSQEASLQRASAFRDSIRLYMHRRDLMDEVINTVLYVPSDLKLEDRVDFKKLDRNIKIALKNNGIDLNYHFRVTTSDGREVYRCPHFSSEGESYATYRFELFPNDTKAQVGIIIIHFPDVQTYIFTNVQFMIPAILFTLILFVIFLVTIYTIVRQKRLTEIKNDFINNMTHEFKTPISTISLAAQMLNDPAVGKSEAMFKHISGIIIDETKRLRFQVDKVLQMSMLDRKAITFHPSEINANTIITDVITTFTLKVQNSGGEIKADLQAANANIYVDEMHFTNVLFNLLDNAVKYRHPDRVLQLAVSTKNTKDGRLVITISDNGIGIRREDLRKVFDRFYRVHTGNRHDVKGFGLGLAYVKTIVRSFDGTIHAESESGRGTQFVITLPTLKETAPASGDSSHDAPNPVSK